ncbi:MAG TPA: sigma-54-dependent transcriptional regulator [Candidatus Hypogeohydataceae bacterium YC41]
MNKANILIVDDEPDMVKGLALVLKELGEIRTSSTAEEAIEYVHRYPVDVLVTDIRMPGIGGISLLEKVRDLRPRIEVIILTAYGSIESAIEAMKKGAYHYVTKPFNNDELLLMVQRALQDKRFHEELEYLRKKVNRTGVFENIIGRDWKMQDIFETIKKVAPSKVPILIQGESGTGKELIARAIHQLSPRAKNRFLGINAAALPENLLEAELFGYKKGAFTGADYDKKGLLIQANQGTLFLDEIGSMSLAFQSKLLRVIQEMEVIPVGATEPVKIDVRFISATNSDMEKAVKEGTFREDLYYRLNVVRINVPPLRERKEDIPTLATHFLDKWKEGEDRRNLTPGTLRRLMEYDWPGNVRELENVIQRAMLVAENKDIQPSDILLRQEQLPWLVDAEGCSSVSYDKAKEEVFRRFQREYFTNLLKKCHGNISLAAEKSGITRTALHRIIKKLALSEEILNMKDSTPQVAAK